jgi:sterol desaturase/sphingolipid hydroxylase (fatty acid hydroxylase superfamily)
MEMKLFYAALAVFFIGGSFLEYFLTCKEQKEYYSLPDTYSSIRLMLTGLLLDIGIKTIAIYLLVELSQYAPVSISYSWWGWLLCFIAWDFIFYWKHRMEHSVRFMWAIHVNHHSSPLLNLSTSLRSGIFKSLYRYFFYIPVILAGFPPAMFMIVYGLGKLWAFFSHSQRLGRWGVMEKILITPAHHSVHHSCNKDNLNKNFGETLVIWDKLFGTFAETKEKLVFGIEEEVNHKNFYHVVMHEMNSMIKDIKATKNSKEKLMYLVGKPGWKPGTKNTIAK